MLDAGFWRGYCMDEPDNGFLFWDEESQSSCKIDEICDRYATFKRRPPILTLN